LNPVDRILSQYNAEWPMDLKAYLDHGGYQALRKALKEMTPGRVIEEVKKSGLRGRGGAGFPTGRKWDRVAGHRVPERYLVCNAGEHEPGTFKDRQLLKNHPHQLFEGILIASYAVGAKETYLFMNEAFGETVDKVKAAIEEARKSGYGGDRILGSDFSCDIRVFVGPDQYVAGEETAMLEVMQGRKATPQHKPPFYPTEYGLYGKPTVVNNVETLSTIPHIIANGGEWFSKIGAPNCPGTMFFSLSGDVKRPGLYELPLGTSLRTLIEKHGGGLKPGRKLKAVFPGGPSFSLLTEKEIDVPMDFDSLKKAGTGLGSAGVIVVDDAACMVRKVLEFAHFFEESSCGKCPPCKMGGAYLHQIVQRIESGEGKPEDIQSLEQLSGFVKGRGDCTVITGAAVNVEGGLRHFRAEFEDHIANHRCPVPG
jgi:NADH-quinone oxidoreductase subunit F